MSLQMMVNELFRVCSASLATERGDGKAQPVLAPTDLRWSRSGDQLAVCAGGLVVFTRRDDGGEPFITADNPAGTVRLAAPHHYKPFTRKPKGPRALSVDFGRRGELFSAWSDGTVRFGHPDESVTKHEKLAELQGVRRIRVSPSGVAALATETSVSLLRGDVVTALAADLPKNVDIAWQPARDVLAVATNEGLALFDGDERRDIALDRDDELGACGPIAWVTDACVTTSSTHLLVATPSKVERLARPGDSDAPLPLAITASPDGRFVVASFLGGEDSTLEIFDLQERAAVNHNARHYWLPGCPMHFSPAGDALAWADQTPSLHLVPFASEVPESHFVELERQRALLAEVAELEAAGELVKALTVLDFTPATDMYFEHSTTRARIESALKVIHAIPAPLAPKAELRAGHTVSHKKFGDGTVVSVEGIGPMARVVVTFDAGEKTLRASFLTHVAG